MVWKTLNASHCTTCFWKYLLKIAIIIYLSQMQGYMNCFLKLIKVNKAKQLKDISKIINLLSWSESDEKVNL